VINKIESTMFLIAYQMLWTSDM